jgi:hypothetical protein
MLDPQMGSSLGDAIAETVPAIDGTVVCREGGERGDPAIREDDARGSFDVDMEQNAVAGDLFPIYL